MRSLRRPHEGMRRDLARLSDRAFDLLVIGGGISGACMAWDATLRGLSVALIEKSDFGGATSAASSKLIHGGIRYLQQGLLHKVRESIVERRHFLRIAPHLVHTVPFLVPGYGHGLRGRALLAAGMALYDLLGVGGIDSPDPGKRLSGFQLLNRDEILALETLIPREGLTGGVLYHECQMYSSERTTLAFVSSAAGRGAEVANYVEALELLQIGDRVAGVRARDIASGDSFEIRAQLVANVTGPWAFQLVDSLLGRTTRQAMTHSKGCHLVTEAMTNGHAVALTTSLAQEAIVTRGGRHIFLIPWREHTLIGTTDVPYSGVPDDVSTTNRDVDDFLAEIHRAIPTLGLTRDKVLHAFCGLYPLVNREVKEQVYQGSGTYRIYDHGRNDGIDGVITVLGAKYTTARRLAERCVDLAFRKLTRTSPPCATAATPVEGGDINCFDDYLAGEIRAHAELLGPEAVRDLVYGHGSDWRAVLALVLEDGSMAERVSPIRATTRASVRYAVREEMAVKLADVVFRRTGLGTLGHPGTDCLRTCAAILAEEPGWSAERTQLEIGEVEEAFRRTN